MEIPSKDICAHVYFPQEKYLQKRYHQGKPEVLRSRHIKKTEFRSHCCFCVSHEKHTDKLSLRQQSSYWVKNARNALSRKHCTKVLFSGARIMKPCLVIIHDILYKHTPWPVLDIHFTLHWLCFNTEYQKKVYPKMCLKNYGELLSDLE